MMKILMQAQSQSKAPYLMLLLIVPVALLTGFISALGIKQLDMLWIAALGGVALLALSTQSLIWVTTILALLVVGQAMYFAGMGQAVWIPFGMGLLMFLRAPMVYASSPFSRIKLSPPLVYPVLFFMAAVLLSMLINTSQLFQAFRAAKSYIFLWSIFFVIAFWGVKLDTLDRIWRFCIAVTFMQLPLVLYQYFFVASKRSNLGGAHGVSWDAIVGGFGGDPMGGGASGTMAWFLVFASVLCIALYRRKLISKWLLYGVLATSAICVGLAEVKVVVLLLPLGLGALLLPYIRKNPFMVIMGLLVSLVSVFAMLVLYGYMRNKAGSFDLDALKILNDAFWYSIDPRFINFSTGEMGRVASIVHWWQENGLDDPLHTLFGHGPGSSSHSGTFGAGEIARKYSFDINRSTLSIFLWDIGLVGVSSYLLILFRALSLALKASRDANVSPFQAAVLEAVFGGLFMVLLMLPYGRDVTEVPALGILLMLFLGYVSQSYSQHRIFSGQKNE